VVFETGSFVSAVNKTLWGPPMLVLLLGCGIYLTVRLGFFQIVRVREWMGETLGTLFKKRGETKRGISPYQALSSALGATVGSGNMIGVATAIASGGAGAVFWMWLSAVFGMATKYAEIYLAVKFRKETKEGFVGGPMYYIEKGLGRGYKWLAAIFAIAGALACIGMGAMNQANSISTVVTERANISPIAVSVALMLACGVSISGGIGRLSRTVEKLVPFMAMSYVGVCLFILISDVRGTYDAFSAIFREALTPRAVFGGVWGESVRRALRFGIARGVFSNEAGLGSSPIVHAAAETKSPEKQGYWGVLEVFIDTIVICTMTALVVISSGCASKKLAGAEIVTSAFSSHLGTFGEGFAAFSATLFALTTILGWSYYGESCVGYLLKERKAARKVYRALFVLGVGAGALLKTDYIWELSDMFNGMMMVPNLIGVLLLSDVVIKKSG